MNVKSPIKTAFFGTHDFAATILQGLLESPVFSVELLITRPDEPVGRSQKLVSPPVKVLAESKGIRVEQPENLKNYRIEELKNYDLGITAQYGELIPKNILEAFPHGMINVHTSLLPKYRGASPIQSALINGEKETGVTIMLMDEGLDTGSILLQKKFAIDPDDTYSDVEKKLAELAVPALLEAGPQHLSGELKYIAQDETQATFCKKLEREDGKIDWHKSAQEIYNLYRGLTPWPGVWTMWNGKRLKLLSLKIANKKVRPGKIFVEEKKMFIGCGHGSIEVLELQMEGKKAMDAKMFLNGHKEFAHATLA